MSELRMGDKEVLDIFRAVTDGERLNWWQRHKFHLYIYHSLLEKKTTSQDVKEAEQKKKKKTEAWVESHSDEHADLKAILAAIDALIARPERT